MNNVIILAMFNKRLNKTVLYILMIVMIFSSCSKAETEQIATTEQVVDITALPSDAPTFTPEPTLEPTPEPTPTPEPHVYSPDDGRPWYVRVDTYNQMVSVYALDENEEYTRLINQFMCTAGKRDNYTKMLFQVLNDDDRYRWKHFATFGGGYCEYVTRIYKPFLFHSMMFEDKSEDELMTATYTEMTFPDSHGCIRLMPQDAKWVYDNCIGGTYVEVVNGEADPDLLQSYMPPPLIDGDTLPVHEPFVGEVSVPAVSPDWDNFPSDGGWEYDPEVYG